MAEETGTIYVGKGRDPSRIQWIQAIDAEQINNAVGSNETYINGKGKPDQTGYAWMLGPGPHRVAGELLYFGMKADAADALVSANCSLILHEAVVDASGMQQRRYAIADRETTTTAGGLADDMTTVPGQIVPILALPALKAGEAGKLTGHVRLVTADV